MKGQTKMELVHDINRPDINGNPPKMQHIAEQVINALNGMIPHLSITTNDNLMSSIHIRGNLTPKEQWTNGIYENGKYFIIRIIPDGKRYYNNEDKVTLESVITRPNKLRKYTGPVPKVIEKLKDWLSCTIRG
jgi:hypothetical protein